MKHTLPITTILISLFIITQIFGLLTITKDLDIQTTPTGEVKIVKPTTIVGEEPVIPDDQKTSSWLPLFIVILIGTGILLLLIKLNLQWIWKYWFLAAIIAAMAWCFFRWVPESLANIHPYLPTGIALGLAIILALVKVFKPNVIIHNLTEIFVYTGITLILLPFINLYSAFGLLILISLYDMYAVWKSKHMVKLAEFQLQSKLFAGLAINYNLPKKSIHKSSKKMVKSKSKNAILGGGDIVFPLIFSAAVLEFLIQSWHQSITLALLSTFIITITTAIALSALLMYSKKDHYYPAMPFISAGCFSGFIIIFLLNLI